MTSITERRSGPRAIVNRQDGARVIVYAGENTAEATRQATLASTYADNAAASALLAEGMNGPTYASTAAGLAATVDGQGFAVNAGSNLISVYLNDGGSAVLQRTVATTAALAAAGGAALVGAPIYGTIADWQDRIVSIKEYGAVGDGSTDDTAAIEAAIASGRKTFWVPAGTYLHDAIAIASNVRFIRAPGTGGTTGGYPVFKLKNSATGDQFTVADTATLSLDGIVLDGNSANQSVARSAIVCSTGGGTYRLSVTLRNVLIRDYTGYGLYLGLNRNAAKINSNSLISGCKLGCLYADGAQDIQAFDTEFSQSEAAPVITIASAAGASASHLFVGCRAYYGGHSYNTLTVVTAGTPGILISGANNRGLTWLGGQINAMTGEAVKITATETISSQSFNFINVEYNGNSKGSAGTYSNIYTATRYAKFSGHYADYAGVYTVKYILETAAGIVGAAIDCDVSVDSTGYSTAYTNGTVARGPVDRSSGQRIAFSASVQNVTLDFGQVHLDVNANGESVAITTKTCHQIEGYTFEINVNGIASTKTVTVSKATGGVNFTITQRGLYRCTYINGAWVALRLGPPKSATIDAGSDGFETYNSAGGTVTVPTYARLVNITSASAAVTLSMPADREIGGEAIDVFVRGYTNTISVAKSSGAVTSTAITSTGLWRVVYTQGAWKASLLGSSPA